MGSTIRRIILSALAAVLLTGASSAYADSILNYQITGPGTSGAFNASFSLPQNPTPDGGGPLSFWFSSLPVNVNGTTEDLLVVFDSTWLGGGVLGVNSFYLFGPQLYSWSYGSPTPTMNVGGFKLFGAAGDSGGVYYVTVTDPPAVPVPEPTPFALLIVGLLAVIGYQLFRRLS